MTRASSRGTRGYGLAADSRRSMARSRAANGAAKWPDIHGQRRSVAVGVASGRRTALGPGNDSQ